MASIRDVAKRAGVGVGTVSRVLNNTGYVSIDTKKKIQDAIDELGYKPNELARNLFRNRTGIIGVIVPDLEHPFFANFVKSIEIELYQQGYKTMVCNTIGISNREIEYLDMLERNMVDGIVTASHTLKDEEEYLKRKKRIVSLDRYFGPEIPIVASDHAMGGKMAAEILLKNNCRRVLDITGIGPGMKSNERHRFFREIIEAHGGEVIDIIMERNSFSYEAYWQAAYDALRNYDGIDGIFATDQPALCYMNLAMQEGKRIPEDVKIVGYDGMNITKMCHPKLSCICQNIQSLSERCAATVIDLIEEREPVPQKQFIDVFFRQGNTTEPVELNGLL